MSGQLIYQDTLLFFFFSDIHCLDLLNYCSFTCGETWKPNRLHWFVHSSSKFYMIWLLLMAPIWPHDHKCSKFTTWVSSWECSKLALRVPSRMSKSVKALLQYYCGNPPHKNKQTNKKKNNILALSIIWTNKPTKRRILHLIFLTVLILMYRMFSRHVQENCKFYIHYS